MEVQGSRPYVQGFYVESRWGRYALGYVGQVGDGICATKGNYYAIWGRITKPSVRAACVVN